MDLLGNTITKGDISGNDASFNNMDINAIESTNWYIKANGDISGNDISFNNMDINAIESNNWYIKANGDMNGNDASFNNIEVTKDISGNTSRFVSMQVDIVTSNNWTIKENGDVSGNDASFNNMDINAIESTNWYIKANGDVSGNDVSFNSIYVTNDISANKWDIKQNGDISGNDASFNNIYLTGTTFFTGEVTGNDASFNKIRINKICGREFPVVGEFNTSWSAMGDRLNGNSNDYFGESMSFNSLGDVVVVGIPDTGSNKGEIKAYRWNGSAWNQAGNTIEGPTNNGYFGRAVDINGAGDIIIVGGKDVGKYGTKRGLVRTYRLTKNYRNDGKWEQFGQIYIQVLIIIILVHLLPLIR